MDPSQLRTRLRDDFRRQFHGELLLDGASRNLYATDASLFRVEPLAIALPRDESDLSFLARYCHERSIPLIPRGAGTGVAGESLGHGLVIDLSVHFRSILDIGPDWVRVQPGVVLDSLNAALASVGRRFAPDPASGRACTIGGMIATDASGGRAAVHGYTRDHIRALRVVWDDGTAAEVGPAPLVGTEGRTAEIVTGIRELVLQHAAAIASAPPRPRFNRCGYRLDQVLDGDRINLVRLLVGSEGTLSLTSEATLGTIPLPGGRAAIAWGFPSFDAALDAALLARSAGPAACDVLDRRLLSVARSRSASGAAVPPEVEAILIVEHEGETPAEAVEAIRSLQALIEFTAPLNTPLALAEDAAAADDLWEFRNTALPSLYALGRGRSPLAFVEDIGVDPDDLPTFMARAKAILKRADVTGSFVVHAATGQVHLRPLLDLYQPADADQLWPLAEELHGLAIDMGGTISAQHGTGIARTPWVERQYGRLYPAFRQVKQVFDPRGILNPGKIVGPDPSRPAWPLRSAGTKSSESTAVLAIPEQTSARHEPEPLLLWEPGEMQQAAAACNGCGACRTEETTRRMCPTFRALHTEAASPRAKANLFRAILDGCPGDIATEEIRAVADLCVNCKMCASECPGKADIPKLMLEAKAANHAAVGLKRPAWFQARLDGLAGLGSTFALTSNFLLRRSVVRWAMEAAFGLARRRTLPAFAFRTFLGRARRRGLTRRPDDGPAVAYFVDTFANVFDPSIGEATVAVLKHNGVPVYVPTRQRGTGATALAQGDTDVARERLAANVRRFVDAARAGDTIVCSEPTAAVFFRLDAAGLLDDSDVRLVASRTVELTSFLWSLHQEGRLRTDFQPLPITVGHHVPCHIKALAHGIHGPDLLALIPDLRVHKIDVSCSGMAGNYGLQAANVPASLVAGRPMLDELSRPRYLYGSSECSACRLQMMEGTGKRTIHPVQYLALAYGLMPSVADRLRRPFLGRVSS